MHLVIATLAVLAVVLFPMGKVLPVDGTGLLSKRVAEGVRLLGREFGGMTEAEAKQVLEEMARFHHGRPSDAMAHRSSDGTVFVTPELNGYVLDIEKTWFRLSTAAEFAEVEPSIRAIPASKTMNEFPISAIDRANPQRPAVALLVNVDWGEKDLADMLVLFKKHGVKATFFVSGRFAEKFPHLIQQASKEGHEIATHGHLLSSGPEALAKAGKLKADIEKSVQVIERVTGRKVTYYAPHMSEVNPAILKTAKELGLRTILYSVDTIDWRPSSTAELIAKRAEKAKAGDFILLHPKPNTVKALERMIGRFREQGLSTMTVTEILSPEAKPQGSAAHE